jgi:hypothetical protein
MYNRGLKHGLHGEPMTCQVLTCLLYLCLPVPTRLTYPISEQNLNHNYTAASTAIGGDEQTTKFFWDKN